MKIQQTTLEKIKAYILDTQANSTYNSAPHEPLEMCFYSDDWNLGNCYKYLNRYLSTKGEKKGDIKSLYKTCHYAWLEYVQIITTEFKEFKQEVNDKENINEYFDCDEINEGLTQAFKEDDSQVTGLFWSEQQYARLAILLIQKHETNHIDLETT